MTAADIPSAGGIPPWQLDLGATCLDNGRTRFRVWAPKADSLSVVLFSAETSRTLPLKRDEEGYFSGTAGETAPGDLYLYRFEDGTERPDPASRSQPRGVHGPSRIVDPSSHPWEDGEWEGLPLEDYLLYELHVGTFTMEGTFAAVIPRLDDLLELGVTAIELMPVAQFPGERNWGYDGAFPFAPQNSYGGPEGLKKLVDACHRKGLAVVLDVVYNHLGPEGNYLGSFGPYFTDRYRTPWGEAINFDGPDSDEVRRFFIGNALYWVTEYHVDALRLDAIHGIFDFSARHILQELAEAVHREGERLGRRVQVIAESSLNDVRTITPVHRGGHGLDAQWNDDFHHALHTLLTGEKDGYYRDFGDFSQLGKAFAEGFVYSGEYSPFRRRRHGSPSANLPPSRFVVFSQNHDQVGNRMRGERLSSQVSPEKLKLAAAAVLLSPFLPLLFMGEEYAERAPFPYFIHHGDAGLIEAVRQGRKEEFAAFAWQGEIPDPQAKATFLAAKVNPGQRREGMHRTLFEFYRQLIRLRKERPSLKTLRREGLEVIEFPTAKVLALHRHEGLDETLILFHFGEGEQTVSIATGNGPWSKLLDSADEEWGGSFPLAAAELAAEAEGTKVSLGPWSFVLYGRE
ncbi:maltooligosyl trehalose hydrolase [Desulfuromonas soudanensis]|uniref:Malto-oligosyltrehalose trehalohydrolase n=1 Tax=Desulfuromonas soudanensis TaxID=1603606 RepID=A0A0M5IQQ7_9BACT|nr:malto-oligosyltrehalose trehalohydrolase [Desulfuromonas soudanensis]ALC15344.1 maltooligosyl trehalose hydrolase [Desulfuromonas soudanensis]